ncbi:MAG: hypothetical protein V2J25_04915 [Desulfatiglans sp.]|nr:hypothetical protein [Desulfatiglans sp.]
MAPVRATRKEKEKIVQNVKKKLVNSVGIRRRQDVSWESAKQGHPGPFFQGRDKTPQDNLGPFALGCNRAGGVPTHKSGGIALLRDSLVPIG